MLLAIYLFVVGLCLGSFVNALVWRLHQQSKNKEQRIKNKPRDLSILSGRSQCPHCGHVLKATDLVPVFSWLWLRGKCRYCHKPISSQYPLVELATGLVFALSYVFWPGNLHVAGQLVLFTTWLAASVGLMALLVYDLKWMLLPNKLIYPTLAVAAAGQFIYLVGFAADKWSFLSGWLLSVLVASGIFLVLFLASQGRWIGYGDVRLGLITGTLLHSPAQSFLMIFIASVLGTVFALPNLFKGKLKLDSHLPYGPFLIVATFVCVLFGRSLTDLYLRLFVPG